MYRMMEIASHADIELEAKIQYIIEGIPDEPLSKTILYGARSINDLRKRLTQYEAMKNIQKSSQKNQSTKPGKDVRREGSRVQDGKSTDVKRCHNCGEKNHRAAECPSKSKGTKCFKCQDFGHIAANCETRADVKQVNECNTVLYDQKIYKAVNIKEKTLVALIDPGSDLHLIKAEEYIKIGSPPLTGPAISCKSLSKDRISTLGSFSINVEVDGSSYYLTIHIISDIYMNHSLLLGSDLLSYAKIELTKGNAIEIDNIEDSLVKHEIKDLIENYKPQKIKETKVKMNIVLKDEIPVYQRPRRLAPAERVQVSKQIDDWLRDGIIRPSISEYASPITLNGSVRPSEHKTRVVINFPTPTNAKQVQSFLGLTGYFRKFIPAYSEIARPLSDLLKNDAMFRFDDEQKNAFQKLKTILSQEPLLKLYRVGADTELHTDASSYGFGAILCQRDDQDRLFHPVCYASWKTSEAESRYSSYELEVLAVIRALNKFRVYLLGIPFKIVTDCNAFVLTMSKKDLCVRVARWALLLQEFDCTIEHRSGKAMRHVDALSRNLPEIMYIREDNSSLVARLSNAQRDDKTLTQIIESVENKACNDYILRNDILYKRCDGDLLLVIPKSMQVDIIKQTHERGHFGVRKTEQLLKREFWFSEMRKKIDKVIKNCITCILAERKHGKQEGFLRNIPKNAIPLETYHIDHLGPIPSTQKSYAHILVVVDAFTKFTWLYPTKSTSAEEVINRLSKQAVIFGNPCQIVSDRGTAFTSKSFKKYCADEKIEHILIATGVPRGNGQVERINRIVIPVLTKLSAPHPETWYKFVDRVQQYINSSMSRSTGLSPFELLIGKKMRLKDDLELKQIIEDEMILLLQEKRETLREQAKIAIEKVQNENQRVYNRKRKRPNTYSIGDLVAIKRTQITPGSKLYPKYLGPYQIIHVLRGDRYVVSKVGEHEGPRSTTTSSDSIKRWLVNECDSNVDT
ncbi:TF28 protein, partial [Pseudoatta argentina]